MIDVEHKHQTSGSFDVSDYYLDSTKKKLGVLDREVGKQIKKKSKKSKEKPNYGRKKDSKRPASKIDVFENQFKNVYNIKEIPLYESTPKPPTKNRLYQQHLLNHLDGQFKPYSDFIQH